MLQLEPQRPCLRRLLRQAVGLIDRTLMRRFAQDIWAIWEGRWIDAELPPMPSTATPTVVLTVAHAEGGLAAMRYAKRNALPLVTFFHDWWPDIAEVHDAIRPKITKTFRELFFSSRVALCVSPGMASALGEHRCSKILYPIPAANNSLEVGKIAVSPSGSYFRILYFGNLDDYGAMIQNALDMLKVHPTIRLEVRGRNTTWPKEFQREMRDRGLWLPIAPRDQLEDWLNSADAFLVPQVFEPSQRTRMETNFPSKLPEYSQYGKPLVIWGPDYCSSVKWARNGNRALVVCDSDPCALVADLLRLSCTPDARRSLSAMARCSYETEFSPAGLQEKFESALRAALESS